MDISYNKDRDDYTVSGYISFRIPRLKCTYEGLEAWFKSIASSAYRQTIKAARDKKIEIYG